MCVKILYKWAHKIWINIGYFFVIEKQNTFYQYECLGISRTYRQRNKIYSATSYSLCKTVDEIWSSVDMVFSILLPQPLTSFGVDSGRPDSVGISSLSNRVLQRPLLCLFMAMKVSFLRRIYIHGSMTELFTANLSTSSSRAPLPCNHLPAWPSIVTFITKLNVSYCFYQYWKHKTLPFIIKYQYNLHLGFGLRPMRAKYQFLRSFIYKVDYTFENSVTCSGEKCYLETIILWPV